MKPSKVMVASPLGTTSEEASADTAVMAGRPMIPATVGPGQSGGPGVYPKGMRGDLGLSEAENRPRSLPPTTRVGKLIF